LEHTAMGVAKGMEYLHSKVSMFTTNLFLWTWNESTSPSIIAHNVSFLQNIVFRDLKPDNVGFDVDGIVKIFDFGLARDLGFVRRSGEMLGFTGTPRYMANEVGEGKQYGLKVDVYS
jgi:serine/threonine protein kinase